MKDVKGVEYSYTHYILEYRFSALCKKCKRCNAGRCCIVKGVQSATAKSLMKDGINVNFVETLDDDTIYVRTYERGVEDETLSCGTGVTASALISAHNDNGFNRVEVKTSGGKLSVEFEKISEKEFTKYLAVWSG